jgi:hypothetical protein
MRTHFHSTDSFVGCKEEKQSKKQFVKRKLVVLKDCSGKQVFLMAAFSAFRYTMSGNLTVMCASAFLTYKSVRMFGVPEEVIAGFFIVAVFAGEFNQ